MVALRCRGRHLRAGADDAARGTGSYRHGHLLRCPRARSLPLPRGHEESRDRGVDQGTGRFHACDARPHTGPGGASQENRRAGRRRPGASVERPGQQRPLLLPEAAREGEHPQALRARGTCGQGAPARRSGSGQGRPRTAFRHRLLRALPGQPICRLRHLARRFRRERSSRARSRHRQGNRRGDRPRAVRSAVLDRGQSPAVQPPAQARARRAEIRQVSQEQRVRPCDRHRPRARSRHPGTRHRTGHCVRSVVDADRVHRSRLGPCDRNRRQRQSARSRAVRGAGRVVGARRSGLAASGRARRRSDRRGVDRRHAVSAHAQEHAALQDRAARSRESRSRDGIRSSFRQATR